MKESTTGKDNKTDLEASILIVIPVRRFDCPRVKAFALSPEKYHISTAKETERVVKIIYKKYHLSTVKETD